MPTWSSFTDVQKRLAGRTIDTTNEPTQDTVDAWLVDAETDLTTYLAAGGVTAADADTNGQVWLKKWAVNYAEGLFRRAQAATGGDGGNDDGTDKIAEFEEMLEKIANNPDRFGALLLGGLGSAPDSTRRLRSHILDHPDGDSVSAGDFDPEFTRNEVW